MSSLTLGEALRASAARNARHEAIVDGERRITYAELDRRVDRLAHGLRARSVAMGSVVAVLSHNAHEILELYFACARLGAMLCPLNPRSSSEELAWTLDHSGAALVAVEAELQEPLRASGVANVPIVVHRGAVGHPGWLPYESLIESAPAAVTDLADPSPELPVLLLYTLKGQGKPLGALLSHANVLADTLTAMTYYGMSERDRVFQGMPLNHIAGLHMLTIAAFVRGATVVLARQWRPDIVCQLIAREQCTVTMMVPTAMRQLFESDAFKAADLRSLRTVVGAAGQYDRALFAEATYRLRLDRMLFGYGLTEASPIVTIAASTGETLWKENSLGWPIVFSFALNPTASNNEAVRGD